MSKSPKLSILIPTYNREKYISQAIDSVLNQPFDDFEIGDMSDENYDKIFNRVSEFDICRKKSKTFSVGITP